MEQNGDKCQPPANSNWKGLENVCMADGKVVSIDYQECVAKCGEHEKAVDGHCVCKESSVINKKGDKCVLRRECKRTLVSSGVEACTGEDQCPKGLKLGINGHECVSECALWTLGQTGEEQCVKECPPETPAHFTGLCTTCTAEYGPDTKNIFWDPVAEECIDTCPQGTVLPLGGGKTCVDECGTNER